MIIGGTGKIDIAIHAISNACPHCENEDCIEMVVQQKYASLYWIPLFPLPKTGYFVCSHCRYKREEKEFDKQFKLVLKNLIENTKTKWWTWTGTGIILLLVIAAFWRSDYKDKQDWLYIQNPKMEDVYDIEKNGGVYSTWIVDHVAGDTIFLMANRYETTRFLDLENLRNQGLEAYGDSVFFFSKSEILKMYENEEIIGVKRK